MYFEIQYFLFDILRFKNTVDPIVELLKAA